MVVVWVSNLIVYLVNLEIESPLRLIGASVAVVGWMTLILFSKHSDYFVYLTPVYRLLISVILI